MRKFWQLKKKLEKKRIEADEILVELKSGQEKLSKKISDQLDVFKKFADGIYEEGALSSKHKTLIAF